MRIQRRIAIEGSVGVYNPHSSQTQQMSAIDLANCFLIYRQIVSVVSENI